MARETRIVEELGWLKVSFAAAVAVAGSLFSWMIATTDLTAETIAVMAIVGVVGVVVRIVRHIYGLLAELETL